LSTSVLVVEDEAIIASDIAGALTDMGYHVPATATTAVEAVRAVERHRPALVLMDIHLRGERDGIEAARDIRRRYGLPVLLLTAHSDAATIDRAKSAEPYGYLIKPFSDAELRTNVEVALHRHALDVKLAERERWFATTLESIGDAVLTTDSRERITFMNSAAEQVTGWPRRDALGKPMTEVLDLVDADARAIASPVREALRRGARVVLPPITALRVRDRSIKRVDASAAPIVDERGRITGAVVVLRDTSDRETLNRRLAQAERLASLGTMAAGVGHEINNPLSYVIANIGYVKDAFAGMRARLAAQGAGDAAFLHELGEIDTALADAAMGAERVRRIVHDLRKFAHSEPVTRSAVTIEQVIDYAIRVAENEVRHSARVERDYRPTPPVAVSELHVAQVFVSLLTNAAQAIGEGNADAHVIRVATRVDERGRVIAEVADDGPGMSEDVLARVFDPFFTTKPVGSGVGLGLAMAHRTVAEVGGELTAESKPGRGAVFRVSLRPANEVEPEAPPPTRPVARGSQRVSGVADSVADARPCRGRVLVLDDDESINKTIDRVLRGEHEVMLERDPRRALQRLRAGEVFDVVLCDLMMPALSGSDFYETLRAERPDLARRVVFMTGGAISPRAEEFLATVSQPVVSKPFEIDELRRLITERVAAAR
jgi:PAS domain S-box-containing protein